MVENIEEVLFMPEVAALIINRSKINIPNIFRNELEKEFELIYEEDEEEEDLQVFMGTKPLSEEFKLFLLSESDLFYGYIYGEEILGNLSESLTFFTKD